MTNILDHTFIEIAVLPFLLVLALFLAGRMSTKNEINQRFLMLVFSTFFSNDTQNYPIYLLSGVVCFSFFSECTTMCLSSISGNSRLITKVYIPKYIFPLSRTISSSINLGISLVPLLLACLVLGIAIKPQAVLFFYFGLICIIFSLISCPSSTFLTKSYVEFTGKG